MSTASPAPFEQHDGRLWALALALSLAANLLIVVMAGLVLQEFAKDRPKTRTTKTKAETITIIAPPEAISPDTPTLAPAPIPEDTRKGFARTSDDQLATRPDDPTHIGERDTQATSDAPPDPTAPARPSQAGVEPLSKDHIETTESRYRDGELINEAPDGRDRPTPPTPSLDRPSETQPAAPATAAKGTLTDTPGADDATQNPPPLEKLATSSLPVDVPVPGPDPDSPPTPDSSSKELPKEGNPETNEETKPDKPDRKLVNESPPPPQTSPNKPSFRGNQRRTVLRGNLSRSGRSALAVENTPLGRYQAQISRAVELEWQRNCVRYRDYITPGFITIRFFVDSRGRIGKRDFVGSMQAGEHQKGFTLDSIRDARIPAMPPELGKDFKDEPLELIFNFYF